MSKACLKIWVLMSKTFKITYTNRFKKQLARLNQNEKKLVYKKLELLVENPFYKSLRTKRYWGLNNVFETSVNMDIRILWEYQDDTIILLLKIGHHDIL